jgi:hypothetical protein
LRQGLVAAAIFGLLAVGSWVVRPRTDPREGSAVIDSGTVKVGERIPRTYRIVYRTHDLATGGPATTRELVVHRPFESRTDDGRSAFGRSAVGPASFHVAPGPPSGDLRPDAVLGDAIRNGYAVKRELRRVAGRLCRVYRIGAPSSSTSLPPLARAEDTTDVCVDEAGLVLEEVIYDGDEVGRRRVATSVTEEPRISDDTFDVPKPDADPRQIGSVQELEPDSRLPGGTFWQLPRSPKGFESRGRFAVVPAGQPGFNDPTAHSSVISFVTEVFTDGPDVLLVEQGATQGAAPFADDPDAPDVDIDGVGVGEVLYAMTGSEVRIRTEGSRFVRVRGTLPPSKLLAIARTLEGVDEGPLRVKDDDRSSDD